MNVLPEDHVRGVSAHNSSLYAQDSQVSVAWIFISAIILAFVVHGLFSFLEYPTLSIPELLWNSFVWMMPSRLVFALRPRMTGQQPETSADHDNESSEHAVKSAVLRDVFRLPPPSDKPLLHKSISSPAGLGNWDNSCYQNSVLQSLASLTSFDAFCDLIQAEAHPISPHTTLATLQDLTRKLNDKANRGRSIWTPPKLKSMSSWQQQDAQEYYSKIMDEVEKDVYALLRKRPNALGISDVPSLSKQTPDGLVSEQTELEVSNGGKRFSNPLDGYLAQRVGCLRCGYVDGLSMIPFNCITLPLGRKWTYDLAECFDEFTNLDMIEGVECAKCSLVQAREQLLHMAEINTAAIDKAKESTPSSHLEQYRQELDTRREAVAQALQDEDFSDQTLLNKCHIGRKQRVCSTKSRQAMIMRSPKCLVMHINRSLFDETTGAQMKNYADVRYPTTFDVSPWCVGTRGKHEINDGVNDLEEWEMDPSKSMTTYDEDASPTVNQLYQLRAVITHYGRHENGHYICYRKVTSPATKEENHLEDEEAKVNSAMRHKDQWWRLSDENVSAVTEEEVCAQTGVFMLFYERIESHVRTNAEATAGASSQVPEPNCQRMDLSNQHELEPKPEAVEARPDNAKMALDSMLESGNDVRVTTDLPSESSGGLQPARGPDRTIAVSPPSLGPPELSTESMKSSKKPLSPAAMRTAGSRHWAVEESEPFKAVPMVSPT